MKSYTIELREGDAARCERLACIEGVDVNELIARALTSEEFFLHQEMLGRDILIEYPDERLSRVYWRRRYRGNAR